MANTTKELAFHLIAASEERKEKIQQATMNHMELEKQMEKVLLTLDMYSVELCGKFNDDNWHLYSNEQNALKIYDRLSNVGIYSIVRLVKYPKDVRVDEIMLVDDAGSHKQLLDLINK